MYILIIAIIVPFVFVNSYQVFDHFHEVGKNSLAKEGSPSWRFLAKKLFAIVILSIVSVFIAISLVVAIKDVIFSDSGWILKISFFISFSSVLAIAFFRGKNKIIQENVNEKIENYMQNFTSSILLAIGFSVIMFIVSYYFMKVDLGIALEDYLAKNMPKQDENNLLYIVESISVLKTYFVYYAAKVLGEDLVRTIFSLLLFVQTLFIFYYSSIVLKTIKNITTGRLSLNWYAVIPLGLSVGVFLMVPDYKKDINTVVNQPHKEKEEKDKEITELNESLINSQKKYEDAKAFVDCINDPKKIKVSEVIRLVDLKWNWFSPSLVRSSNEFNITKITECKVPEI